MRDALYYLSDAWRLGDQDRAENAQWFATEFTTHADADTEFTVRHGLASAPGRFIPVMRLNEVGNQAVPLVVTRAADATFAYFRSSSTGAVMSGFFET